MSGYVCTERWGVNGWVCEHIDMRYEHVWVCVHREMRCERVWVCTHRDLEVRGWPWLSFSISLHLILWNKVSLSLECADSGRLAGLLFPPPQSWDYRNTFKTCSWLCWNRANKRNFQSTSSIYVYDIYIFYTYFNHRNYSRDWKFQNEWHIESETSESRGGEVIENRVYKDAEKGENDVIKVLSGWGHKRNNLLSLGISKIQALNDDIWKRGVIWGIRSGWGNYSVNGVVGHHLLLHGSSPVRSSFLACPVRFLPLYMWSFRNWPQSSA